jgi:hypothetical protein
MEATTEFPWATALMVLLCLIVAGVGGVVVIFGDEGALTFQEYVNVLQKFAIAIGLLAVGRGVRSGLRSTRR